MNQLNNPNLFREKCYINGEWVAADNSKTISVENPFDQKTIGTIPDMGADETRRAIDAANHAFSSYKALSSKQRTDLLMNWHYLIDENKEDLAKIMTIEQGKPIIEARSEIDYANGFVRWFAEEGRRVYGDIIPSNNRNQHLLVLKQPVGVVGAITPWNFPAAMITRKIAPALAVGCTVVVKPAAETPYSAFALAVLAEEAGFPKGVLNIITGDANAIGAELTSNPIVRKVSFTGSTRVGKLLMEQCAGTIKKLSLELGGNAPFIVFEDADLDAALQGAIACKFRNTGQTCVSANRILVQAGIYSEFAEKLVDAVGKMKIGNGLSEDVKLGPLINKAAIEKVKAHVADAVSKGANVLLGGEPHNLGGLFYQPTVLTRVTTEMKLAQEETFGPVAALFKFEKEEDAIKLSNDTPYGLASYFYSKNIDRIWRVAEALEYGMVGVNAGIISTEVAPFGGIKESGIGREGSKYGLDEYLELKYLCVN